MKCKIIQDLLPLYCDKLTSPESNEEIEIHLHNCEDCNQLYENMCQKEESIIKASEKEINPLKKIRRKTIMKTIIGVLVSSVLLFGIFMFVFWGVIPINSNRLELKLSVSEDTSNSWILDEEDNPTEEITVTEDELNITFIGDCNSIRHSMDVQYLYCDNGSMNSHYEITIYPAVKLPFDEQGDYPNQLDFSIGVKEGDTLTIHYKDKDVIYNISDLAEQAKRENN